MVKASQRKRKRIREEKIRQLQGQSPTNINIDINTICNTTETKHRDILSSGETTERGNTSPVAAMHRTSLDSSKNQSIDLTLETDNTTTPDNDKKPNIEFITPSKIMGTMDQEDRASLRTLLDSDDKTCMVWATNIAAVHGAQLLSEFDTKLEEGRDWLHPGCNKNGIGGRTWVAFIHNARGDTSTTKVQDIKRRPRNMQYRVSTPKPKNGMKWRSDNTCIINITKFATESRRKHVEETIKYKKDGATVPSRGYPENAILGLVLFDGVLNTEELQDPMYNTHLRKCFDYHWKVRAKIVFGKVIPNIHYRVWGTGLIGHCEPLLTGYTSRSDATLKAQLIQRLPGLLESPNSSE